MRLLLAPFAVLLFSAGPALAGTDVTVPSFSGIEAHGGAHVILHHGTAQHVTVIKGDMKVARITVAGSTLMVDPCPTGCWHSSDLEVEVTAPNVEALTAHGGASIDANGQFPRQPRLNVVAHGGGAVDARAIPAEAVKAEAHGGGDIKIQVLSSLMAEAHGGGDITYVGHPAKIDSHAHGGGSISQE